MTFIPEELNEENPVHIVILDKSVKQGKKPVNFIFTDMQAYWKAIEKHSNPEITYISDVKPKKRRIRLPRRKKDK